jgi:hypothetical protein
VHGPGPPGYASGGQADGDEGEHGPAQAIGRVSAEAKRQAGPGGLRSDRPVYAVTVTGRMRSGVMVAQDAASVPGFAGWSTTV